MIPKVIHYCWFGGKPLPELAIKCINSWKKYCPDYEIKEWNENNFDICMCDYTKEAYKNEKWAFVSDYARFWILYNYGGIYFDTDVELLAHIDDLVEKGPFMGVEKPITYNEITKKYRLSVAPGLGLAAYPNMDLYNQIIEQYHELSFVDKNGRLIQTTVVEIVSKILEKYQMIKIDDVRFLIEDVYIYKKDVFCPLDYFSGVLEITESTRSIHHYTASWQSEEEKRNVEIFIKAKKKYGPILGKFVGVVLTFKYRKIYENIRETFIRKMRDKV